MPETHCTAPVAMLIFNRPEVTARVFERIREARPSTLLVVADGPRASKPGEAERCAAARAVTERVDWDCQVLRNYAPENLGCRRRVSSGLDWVFAQVERAIILEDDCLPDPSFFPYCDELLERFADDERIAAVSGNNFQFGRRRTDYSYYFSRYPHIWGWASWRRMWKTYDVTMKQWPEIRDGNWLNDIFEDARVAAYFRSVLEQTFVGAIDTWDYQWLFASITQNRLGILPNQNLVTNIGFSSDATHTTQESPLANLPAASLSFPLKHRAYVIRDVAADRRTDRRLFAPPISIRLLNRAKRMSAKLVDGR